MTKIKKTIYEEYFEDQKFIDRYKKDEKAGVDVIIPVIHTNILWENNLKSIYREIPVKRLIISDGGCIDDSLKIARKFPRVKILNHKKYVSLGYCIRKMIEAVETDWFIYLHSDVYLPKGWFDKMIKYQKKYDWYECRQHQTILIDYPLPYPKEDRSFSGSQIGRKEAFKKILPKIDDDYLYRNEDLIFADLIERSGGKYGRVKDMFHFHQMMYKKSQWQRDIKSVKFDIESNKKEEDRVWIMQVKGLIKYTNPTKKNSIEGVRESIAVLKKNHNFNMEEFKIWVKKTNSNWLPYIGKNRLELIKLFFLRLKNLFYRD